MDCSRCSVRNLHPRGIMDAVKAFTSEVSKTKRPRSAHLWRSLLPPRDERRLVKSTDPRDNPPLAKDFQSKYQHLDCRALLLTTIAGGWGDFWGFVVFRCERRGCALGTRFVGALAAAPRLQSVYNCVLTLPTKEVSWMPHIFIGLFFWQNLIAPHYEAINADD